MARALIASSTKMPFNFFPCLSPSLVQLTKINERVYVHRDDDDDENYALFSHFTLTAFYMRNFQLLLFVLCTAALFYNLVIFHAKLFTLRDPTIMK